MDDCDIPTVSDLVTAEFSRLHTEAYKNSGVDSLLRRVRDKALFGTIKKYVDKLDRVVVQLLKDGPFKMAYRIQENLFFSFETNCFLKSTKAQLENTSVVTIGPVLSKDLTVQWIQQILMDISEKVKNGHKGKIILPDGYFYFTWKGDDVYEFESDMTDKECVVQADDFSDAVLKMEKELTSLVAKDFRVYYGGMWREIQLVQNGFVRDRWLHDHSNNVQFIEKK